jgi:hypothetical protein
MGDDPTNGTQDIVSAAQREALDIARQLIAAGAPVFVAKPCPVTGGQECTTPSACIGREYHLPAKWQLTVPSTVWLDRWRPGDALAVVGGHVLDVIDEDPRSDGDVSAQQMRDAGQWPRVFGMQTTPSGGRHYLISPTGERETNSFMPGLDLQSGAPDGSGRAFAFIAPTVKRSKAPETLGRLGTYEWVKPPDLEMLAEFGTTDDSIEGVRTRVASARARAARATPTDRGPFATPSQLNGATSGSRLFTPAEALEHCRPALLDLERAPIGQIEERCNRAAVTLSHFVPTMWSAEQAMVMLRIALGHTAYDESHPASAWTVEKFVPVLDGRRPPLDPWKAERRPESLAEVVTPAVDAVDALIAEMLTPAQIALHPAPRPLIKGLLTFDSESWLIGEPGSKKSFVGLDMAGHVATGKPWQGLKVTQTRVVMIVAEGAGGSGLRISAWEQTYGPMGDEVFILPRPVQAANLTAWAVLVEACRRLTPGMVVIDTQARVTVGLEENSAKEMGIYVEAVRAIREATGACVLTVHHTGRKGGDARGSSAIDGAQSTELKVKALDGMRGELITEKQKDLELRPKMDLLFERVTLGVDEDGDPITSLVLVADEYKKAADSSSIEGVVQDPGGAVRISDPGTWVERLITEESAHAPVARQLLQTLLEQGGQEGLTKGDYRKNIAERWYADRPATSRSKRGIDQQTWDRAWAAVEKIEVSGELVMVDGRGQKKIFNPSLRDITGQ